MTSSNRIRTTHGVLAVEEHGQGDTPVLMIHGSSSCRAIFGHQQDASFFEQYRMIGFDLPGHGESDDAIDPNRTYTLPGLADATSELLGALRVVNPIVFGWSLGGHIAIEMLSRLPQMRALLLTGAPPVGKRDGRNDISQGYRMSPRVAGKDKWSLQEAGEFVTTVAGGAASPTLVNAAMRTDRRFRRRLVESSREGSGTNQRLTIEAASLPIAVINGASDPLVHLDYFDTVTFRNLWERTPYRLSGLGHAPFWQQPDIFNLLLARFLAQVDATRPRLDELEHGSFQQQGNVHGSEERA